MKKSVIITAGGSGKRMQQSLPKQFILLNGKPILQHTIEKFRLFDPNIFMVVVLPMKQINFWKELCQTNGYSIDYEIAVGGEERFHSIQHGVKFCPKDGVIAVHDAVRPLVSIKTIDRCFKKAESLGAAIPVLPVNDSLRRLDGDTSTHVQRGSYRIVQTPQCFEAGLLHKAYKQDYKSNFTDDASLVEQLGQTIHLVDGNNENIKITSPNDLLIAESYLNLK